MPTEPTTLCCKSACLTIPGGYEITRHDHVKETEHFAQSLSPDAPLPFDWHAVASIGVSYEVDLAGHALNFCAGQSDDTPRGYLHRFASAMSKDSVLSDELADCRLGPFDAVRLGDYSNAFTMILWCAKVNEVLVHIALRGPGAPSQAVRDDIERILDSLADHSLSA